MTIRTQCPACDAVYNLKDELVGKAVRCKSCGETFTVRASRPPEEEYEVVQEDNEFEEPVARPGRGSSRSRSAIQVGSKKKGRSADTNSWGVWPWMLGGCGVMAIVMLVVCGGLFSGARKLAREAQMAAEGTPEERRQREAAIAAAPQLEIPDPGPPSSPYPVDRYPLPSFPEFKLDAGTAVPGSSVLVQSLILQPPPDKILQPAFQMQMRVYLPAGEHAPGTLPLVLVAPAGTPMFIGNGLDDPTYHDETLPYAEAGAVVIMYSLDGGIIDLDSATNARLSMAYEQFRRAGAGTVNARTALEFALARIPAVDPKKIVVAGHSSAGTASMLFAAHEPRLAAAIAYCPCTDVQTRMVDFVNEVRGNPLFPDIENFLQKSSPRTHSPSINCPVFVFHASDDSNVPYAESQQFVTNLKSAGKDAQMSEPAAFGDHYQPMIDEGIPRAIVWLRSRGIFSAQ